MAESALAAGDAGVCVCCVEALNTFCFLKPYGSGSSTSNPCGGPRGCCGSCFDRPADEEDAFERAQRKERERLQKSEGQKEELNGHANTDLENAETGAGDVISSQPPPAERMHAAHTPPP